MNANKTLSRLLTLGAVIASLGMVPRAFAIDPSHLVQEGNANCSDYGSNKLIFELDDSSLTYSPGEETISDGTVEVTYTIDTTTQVLTFHDAHYLSTGNPPAGINVAILRGDQNKAETYMWGTNEGVTRWPPLTGSSVDLTVTSPQTTINTIALCYGLGLGEEEPIVMPSCDADPDEFPGLTCQSGDEFLSSTSGGETTWCCCPDPACTGTYCCDAETGLQGCILGAPEGEGGCGGDTEFSDFSEDLIGAGSGTRVCKNTSSGYVCYYER